MEVKEHYTLRDFERYAREEFPSEFAALRNTFTCVFERKTYFDENNAVHDIEALLVGTYNTRQSATAVWAQASDTGVRYYSGRSTETICYVVSEMQISRVYFQEPYSSITGNQREKSRTMGRKPGHLVAETVINAMFLLTGRLDKVSNPYKSDMLSNFQRFCKMIASKDNAQETAMVDSTRHPEDPTERVSVKQVSKKRKRPARNSSNRSPSPYSSTEQENGNDSDHQVAQPRNQSGHVSPQHSPMPDRSSDNTYRPSLFEQIRNFETELQATLEQEQQAHDAELKEVQTNLEEQKLRTRNASEKLKRQNEHIRTLQEDLEAQKQRTQRAEEKLEEQEMRIQALETHLIREKTQVHISQGRAVASRGGFSKQLNQLQDETVVRTRLVKERGQHTGVLAQQLQQTPKSLEHADLDQEAAKEAA
ncbi:hypothetical protein E8E13_002190 [Curvularia kusanoi]|uniref:Uncharacterized protein n=1 Tax=Curvularia kusanoi TaxID=90978 RepID=A0A9P4TG66_CURKU|nr:hypothetical protein E8E13_002190 [Curvularia kusanoi]